MGIAENISLDEVAGGPGGEGGCCPYIYMTCNAGFGVFWLWKVHPLVFVRQFFILDLRCFFQL